MRGRNERSSARSSSLWPAAASRAASAPAAAASSTCDLSFTGQLRERLADYRLEIAFGAAPARGGRVDGPARVNRLVAQVDQRGNGVIELRGGAAPEPFKGKVTCYIEFGGPKVARFDGDFLSGPAPVGKFIEASEEMAASKAEFGASRRRRWFGMS